MFDQQLYVFHIEKSLAKTQETDISKTNIKSVAKFPLASQILSFDIVSASNRRYKCGLNDDYLANEMDEYDDETNCVHCMILKMFFVQPKSVQECNLMYQSLIKTAEVKSKNSKDVNIEDGKF